jgi:hypothetical protein
MDHSSMEVPLPETSLDLDASVSERSAVESAFAPLAYLFQGAQGPRSALWVVSRNIGGQTAVRFWADARRKGLTMANPESFHWCLANAACGALARRFQILGPNTTLLGDEHAVATALMAADDGLSQGRFAIAFVIDFRSTDIAPEVIRLRAWCRRKQT